jgi:hypothetical protein
MNISNVKLKLLGSIPLCMSIKYEGGLKSQCKVKELAPLVRIDVISS